MKRPTRKLIAFSAAVASMVCCIMPSAVSADYEAELVEKCEYDELFEMKDKAFLIKNGRDNVITDDTQIVVIDQNGEKTLLSKEAGLSGIYGYVSVSREDYNFINPSSNPYTFDFMDENYRISTESGSFIAGIGNKFVLMDSEGKILSEEYDALYRLSDDYFMADNKDAKAGLMTGLIKADGTVVVKPQAGIGEFYLCGDKFLVSKYTVEQVETENWLGETVTEEERVYSYSFMDKNGKMYAESYAWFSELGCTDVCSHRNSYGYTDKPDDAISRANVSYVFDSDCIAMGSEVSESKCVIYNFRTDTYSKEYNSAETIIPGKYAVNHDGVNDLIGPDFKPFISGAKSISFSYWYEDEYGNRYRQDCIDVTKDGKVTYYDYDLKVLAVTDEKKYTDYYDDDEEEKLPSFRDASFSVNHRNEDYAVVTLTTEDESLSVKFQTAPCPDIDGAYLVCDLADDFKGFDFIFLEDEMGYDYYDNESYLMVHHEYNCLVDSKSEVHIYPKCDKVVRRISRDKAILQKEDGSLVYANLLTSGDKLADLNATDICDVYDWDGINYKYTAKKMGYCLMSEGSFTICDTELKKLTDTIEGKPFMEDKAVYIESGSLKYSVTDSSGKEKYGLITIGDSFSLPPKYDSISKGYGGYLVTSGGNTFILDSKGNTVKEFEGAFKFNTYDFKGVSTTPYEADWNLEKRVDGVTTNIVYNINDKKVKYEQTGLYDKVSCFNNGYAVVINYNEGSEDLWFSNDNAYGIVSMDGIEVVKPSDMLYISINRLNGFDEITFSIVYDGGKNRGDVYLQYAPEELQATYSNAYNFVMAVIVDESRYLVLKDNLWGIYDSRGKAVLEAQFDHFTVFDENGLSIVQTPEYKTYLYYNKYLEEYEEYTIHEKGVIDTKGNVIVKPFTNVIDGMEINNNSYYINSVSLDSYGVQVCRVLNGRPKYTLVTPEDVINDFARTNGYDIARKEGSCYYVEKGGLAGIVSADNKVLVPVEYQEVLSFNPSRTALDSVRAGLRDSLEKDMSSKLNPLKDGSNIVFVETTKGKVGAYRISGEPAPTKPTEPPTTTEKTEPITNAEPYKPSVPDDLEPTIYGDSNLDGAVNVADVVQLNKFLLNPEDNPIEGASLANADCMRDGYIDSSDSTILMNYVSMQITADMLGKKE